MNINNKDYKGVMYHSEDIGNGPFALRQSGTNYFVTEINTNYYGRFGPRSAYVKFEKGWENPSVLSYETMGKAIKAACHVFEIEGTYISIEPLTKEEK